MLGSVVIYEDKQGVRIPGRIVSFTKAMSALHPLIAEETTLRHISVPNYMIKPTLLSEGELVTKELTMMSGHVLVDSCAEFSYGGELMRGPMTLVLARGARAKTVSQQNLDKFFVRKNESGFEACARATPAEVSNKKRKRKHK